MKFKRLLILFLLLSHPSLYGANFLFISGGGVYTNKIDYSQTTLDWTNESQKVEDRIAQLQFAAVYLKFVETLGPKFAEDYQVDITASSAVDAIAQLQKVTGVQIPRKILAVDSGHFEMRGKASGPTLLLKIIHYSSMAPSFESENLLVLSEPEKTRTQQAK